MKQLYKKAKLKTHDLLRPSSRQSTLNSPARPSQVGEEPALVPSIGTYSSTLDEEHVIETAIAPTQHATPNLYAHGAEVTVLGPPPLAKSTMLQSMAAVEHIPSAFDKLRIAMESGNMNIFAPLQAALSEMIRACRFLEVRTDCLK